MATRRVLLGAIGRPHGVRGLVRVQSYTARPTDLASYGPLSDDQGRRFVVRFRGEGLAELALLEDGRETKVADRTAAERLVNTRLYVDRDRLPPPSDDEYYYVDLIGLIAVDEAGAALGKVAAVHDYGAGASLEIAAQGAASIFVPFTRAWVPSLDFAAGRAVVRMPPPER